MNRWTAAGLAVTCLILIAVCIGPLIAPYPVDYQLKPGMVLDADGKMTGYVAPPSPPDSGHWFGTDQFGYDILTLMLHGAKYTFLAALAVAAIRVTAGAGIGMLWGYYRSGSAEAGARGGLLGGIPVFVVTYFMMAGLSFNSDIPPPSLTMMLCAALALIGLPSVIASTANKTRRVKEQPYILACTALGMGGLRTLRSHIFPQLKESFLILFLSELILTLTVFGQLGIFHVFVGGTFVTVDPLIYTSVTHEWAGLAGNAKGLVNIHSTHVWMFFFPMMGYLLMILGFFCLSKGLEQSTREKYQQYGQLG